jgi:hypothetical protein
MERAIRRFSLLDAMIVIAATGIGITIIRPFFRAMPVVPISSGMTSATPIGSATYSHWLSHWLTRASPVVGMWCLALLIASLSRRGVRRRRLFRMPGITASCTLWIVSLGGTWGSIRANSWLFTRPDPAAIYELWDEAAELAGPSIFAVWIIQALAGSWRPAPTWIDRVGRLAGLYWIVTYLFRQLGI